MIIHQFAVIILFTLVYTIQSSKRQRYNAVEFWSNVICSMENIKTVNFHDMLESDNSVFLEHYLLALIHDIEYKCEITIVSKTYMLRNAENITSFATDRSVKQPSIWKITFGNALSFQTMPSTTRKIRNNSAFDRNTWNVHMIVVDIRCFEQISRDNTIFKWNSHDRFIILIAHFQEIHEPHSKISNILKTLWSERKVHKIVVSEMIFVNDTVDINPTVYTYNPFTRVNDSVWGKIEIINVKTTEEVSDILSHLTYHRTKDLNGFELRVGYFKQGQTLAEPTQVSSNTHYDYVEVFKGFDKKMLNTIARSMNFKAKLVHPTDNKSYGYELPNGTYIGAIAYTGDVVHGRTDICFVSFFIKKYSVNPQEDIDFSSYMDFDRLCLVVPKATKIPKGIRIYHFFPPSIWICSMLTHVFTYVTWYFLQVFTLERIKKKSFYATIYRSFLLNVGCPQKLPNTNAERILLSGIFLANVTVVGIFSGILYNSFAHDMYYSDIRNLADLDASGLPISLTFTSLIDLFSDDSDDKNNDHIDSMTFMRNLRMKIQYGINTINNVAYHRNVSTIVRENYFPIITEELIDADGGPLLHLIKECPGKFYLSYLLPKNSILRERINALINRLNEAGLSSLWNQHIIHAFIVQKKSLVKKKLIRNKKKMSDDGFVPFNLSDVQSSFYMLLIGLSMSTIVFFYEKGWLRVSFVHIEKKIISL